MIEHIDLKAEKYVVNRFVDMAKLFDYLQIDYRVNGNMFCPFHANENSPSAHLYYDKDGYRLWCFSENRMYGAWNVYKTYLKNINTNDLAKMILNKLSEEDQKFILENLGAEQEIESLPYKDSLIKFKQHKINITELLQEIANSYIDE